MVDVLFIHPGNHEKIYQELSKNITAIAPPTWTTLLAGYTRNQGYSVAIHDTNLFGLDVQELIRNYQPKLIVVMVYGHQPSASTQTMYSASRIIKKIKAYNKHIPIAIGGTHPSALPERTLNDEKVDYVIIGEGAYQIVGLLNYITGKCGVEGLTGVMIKKKSTFYKYGSCQLIKNLDAELGNHAFDLLPNLNFYRAHNSHCFGYKNRSPYITLNTSLGCPFSCDFCCINALFGEPGIRYWSEDIVLSWIDELVNKYNIQHIRFDDELFILNEKRIESMCDKLIERNYNLNIWVYARVDTIKKDLLNKMHQAGFNWICLGIESANQSVRLGVNKSINRNIRSVVQDIKDSGISIMGNYMFGLPDETQSTMQDTLDLAIELNCEYSNFYCTMAYPGSLLYEMYKSNSDSLPKDWDGYSQHSYETKPLPTKYLTSAQVLKFRDNAFYKYFSNEEYMKSIYVKFGIDAVEQVQDVLKIKIKRRLLGD